MSTHLVVVFCATPILWAGYEVIARAQRTGVWEPLRLFGCLLVTAGAIVAVFNPPEWMVVKSEEAA